VFFAAGFETTTAPVAAMLVEGVPQNLSVLLSGRLTWPAVALLLDSGEAGFDCLIAPGHVATIMGPEEWGSSSSVTRSRRPSPVSIPDL
jgi:hydrogenase expression/formation protein HypD